MKLSVLLSLLLIAGACSPEEDPPPPTGDNRVAGDSDGSGDTDFRPDTCQIDSYITQVTGTVTDELGNGLPGTRALLCVNLSGTGELRCVGPSDGADAAGDFSLSIPTIAQCMRHAVMRVLLPGSDRGTGYCTVELPTDRATVAIAEPFVLFETTRATSLPVLPADQERTVGFSDGLEIDVVPERYFGSGNGYDDLAARQLAPDTEGLCLPDNLVLDSVYAFSPEGDITGDSFPVRIPNTDGLAADTVVDLYLLGGLGCTLADTTHVPEGDWVAIGTATVSADESTIEGGTVPCLNWLGVVAQ